jgi:hypothetical protein
VSKLLLKFKYKLDYCFGKPVLEILEQDFYFERFCDEIIHICSNGWRIKRYRCPEISFKTETIYIRGSTNTSISQAYFGTEVSKSQFNQIKEALEDFTVNYCGQKIKKNNHLLTDIFV